MTTDALTVLRDLRDWYLLDTTATGDMPADLFGRMIAVLRVPTKPSSPCQVLRQALKGVLPYVPGWIARNFTGRPWLKAAQAALELTGRNGWSKQTGMDHDCHALEILRSLNRELLVLSNLEIPPAAETECVSAREHILAAIRILSPLPPGQNPPGEEMPPAEFRALQDESTAADIVQSTPNDQN